MKTNIYENLEGIKVIYIDGHYYSIDKIKQTVECFHVDTTYLESGIYEDVVTKNKYLLTTSPNSVNITSINDGKTLNFPIGSATRKPDVEDLYFIGRKSGIH